MIATARSHVVGRRAEAPYRYRAWIILALAVVAGTIVYGSAVALSLLGGFS